jgi:hypothetical protein
MQTLRLAALAVLLLVLAPLTARAQTPVGPGTTLAFDHDALLASETESYQLCIDAITDAACLTIPVVRVGTTNEYRLTLPGLTRGAHTLSVRAVGYFGLGPSAPSNTLSVKMVGKPGPPANLRMAVTQ